MGPIPCFIQVPQIPEREYLKYLAIFLLMDTEVAVGIYFVIHLCQ